MRTTIAKHKYQTQIRNRNAKHECETLVQTMNAQSERGTHKCENTIARHECEQRMLNTRVQTTNAKRNADEERGKGMRQTSVNNNCGCKQTSANNECETRVCTRMRDTNVKHECEQIMWKPKERNECGTRAQHSIAKHEMETTTESNTWNIALKTCNEKRKTKNGQWTKQLKNNIQCATPY